MRIVRIAAVLLIGLAFGGGAVSFAIRNDWGQATEFVFGGIVAVFFANWFLSEVVK